LQTLSSGSRDELVGNPEDRAKAEGANHVFSERVKTARIMPGKPHPGAFIRNKSRKTRVVKPEIELLVTCFVAAGAIDLPTMAANTADALKGAAQSR
jgi:hypothetical protein